MSWFFSTTMCIIFEIIGLVINIANSYIANIIVFEVTGTVSFNWNLLFSNNLFWIISGIQLVYGIASICINHKNKKNDRRLKRAIEDHEILLLGQVVNYTRKGDFDSASKVISILDEFEERRGK